MSAFEGSLTVPGDFGPSLGVTIDLSDSRIRILAGAAEIGDWDMSEILVKVEEDGFHVRVEGEEMILDVDRDAEFALDLGLRSGPPLLRRRMSAILRGQH